MTAQAFVPDETAITGQVAIKVFSNIMEEWGVKTRDRRVLLGDVAKTTYHQWVDGGSPKLSRDVLERISHIVNIYKALHLIFVSHDQANGWVRKANLEFHGKSALDVMLQGSILDLQRVHAYLDGVRG